MGNKLTPDYQIEMGDEDITGNFNDRVLKIEVAEKDGNESDTMSIELDDRDFAIETPKKGATLKISLGYVETGVAPLGSFTVDEIKFSIAPDRKIEISGKSADMSSSTLKQHRTMQYKDKTLGDIVKDVADRQGLQSYVSPSLASINYSYLHQTEESDLHLLTRLAKKHGALFKVAGGSVLFTMRGETSTANGGSIGDLTLDITEMKSCVVTLKDREKHKKVHAHWHDKRTGKRMTHTEENNDSDAGQSEYHIRHLYEDEDKAKSAAKAKMSDLKRDGKEIEVEIGGDNTVTASGNLIIEDTRDPVDGTYTIKSATHTYDKEGYVTKIGGEDKEDGETDSSSDPSSS